MRNVTDDPSEGTPPPSDMWRTTGGLLQGSQRALTRDDLESAVSYLYSQVKDEAVRKALRLGRFPDPAEKTKQVSPGHAGGRGKHRRGKHRGAGPS